MTGPDAATTVLSEIHQIIESASAPLVVHIVANGVRGDSRVIKAALTSARQGLATLVLGLTNDAEPQSVTVDGVQALLLPYPREPGLREAEQQWRQRSRAIGTLRLLRQARSTIHGRPRQGHVIEPREPVWAAKHPAYLSLNTAFMAGLDSLKPTIIHVHDTAPLPSAIAHASTQRLGGRRARVLYDAHECVPELVKSFVDRPAIQALGDIERAYIRDADLVVTVSRQIAVLLQRTYGLPKRPRIVTNAPSAQRDGSAPSLRHELGLSDTVALAVYSGGTAPERGLATVLRAMPRVESLHLAIVCRPKAATVAELLRTARALSVLDRVHLVDYVPPSQITAFLSSASIGLVPHEAGGHLDLSLPTKYREYLHAGLPIIVSTNKAIATATRKTGVGEVFKAGDPRSLARALLKVLANTEQYRRAITDEILTEHSWEEQRRVLETSYTRLAKPMRPQPALPDLSNAFRHARQLSPAADDHTRRKVDAGLLLARVGIGRSNPQFHSHALAEAASELLGVHAAAFAAVQDPSRRPHVAVVSARNLDLPRATAELVRIVTSYTHVLIDGSERLFGDTLGPDVGTEAAILRRNGLTVGMIVHDDDPQLLAVAARFDGPVFTTRLDLLPRLPGATWLPAVVPTEDWMTTAPMPDGRRPLRVLELAGASGSATRLDAVESLAHSGLIEQVRPDGHAVDLGLLASVDIVVSQPDSYDTTAVRAMAAGRVVIGRLSPNARQMVSDEIPIIDAPMDGVNGVLAELVNNPERLRRLSTSGRMFAETWHDGRASAQALIPFIRS